MARSLLIFMLICCSCVAQAQEDDPDSLRGNLGKFARQDTARARAIYQYLYANLLNNNEGDLRLIHELIRISDREKFSWGQRKGYLMMMSYYGDRSGFDSSFLYGDSLALMVGKDSSEAARRDEAMMYSYRANNYHKMSDFDRAVEENIKAVKVFEQFRDTFKVTQLYLNISDIYSRMDDTTRSLAYTVKAVDYSRGYSNTQIRAMVLLGYAAELGTRRQDRRADSVLNLAWPLVQKLERSAFYQNYFYMRGAVRQYAGDHGRAIPWLKTSLSYAYKREDMHQITGVMQALYDCYLETGAMDDAKRYLDSVMILAQANGLALRRMNVYEGYARYYEKLGQYPRSIEFLKKLKVLSDSLNVEDQREKIASLEVQYKVAGKEQEIRRLQAEKALQDLDIRQKNIINYILMGSALALGLILFLTYRNYRHRQRLQQQRIAELETEKQLAATEAVLKGEEQERTRLAKDLHDGLGGMLSGIKYALNTMKGNLILTPENAQAFERSIDMLDSSIKEMRRVAHNMMPEALVKFGLDVALKDICDDINASGALKVDYQGMGLADPQLDNTTSITIYRIVQELLNNTMKHASARHALVQVIRQGGQVAVTVEDDGKGFDTGILKGTRGIGWSNIAHRVAFLKGQWDVESAPGKGTSVHIEITV